MAVIEAIATTYLEADASLIEFTSIPQTYEHLQLRISARQANNTQTIECTIRLGTGGGAVDTGNNYYTHRMYSYGASTVRAGGGTARDNWKYIAQFASGTEVDAGQYGGGVIDILDYANANKNTTALSVGGQALGATYSWMALGSGLWDNAGAVDRIAIAGGYSSDFVRGTEVTLYGLKSS